MSSDRAGVKPTVKVPPYAPLGVDVDTWAAFAAKVNARQLDPLTTDVSGAPPPAPGRIPPLETRDPIDALREAIASPNTRVVNVRLPEADLFPIKRIENRSIPFPEGGGWAFVVASKIASPAEYNRRVADARRRCAWEGSHFDVSLLRPTAELNDFRAQRIVALVKFESVANADAGDEKQSVWNNGDKFAWVVKEHYKFCEPVWYGTGCLSLVRFSTAEETHPGLTTRIVGARMEQVSLHTAVQ